MPAFSLSGCELGVATAATQIEGGNADTTWHRWAAAGGIPDGSSPARAADHWNRVAEDVALLGELGIRHYRMGLEWARLEPRPGNFDQAALDHYRDELTRLRDAGVRPLVTLHHFNPPGWFVEAGDWLAPGAVPAFLRFTARIVREFGDLVQDWITINEPNVHAAQSFLYGLWPPGEHSYRHTAAVLQGLVEAHLRAYLLIHQLQPGARVAVAHHVRAFAPLQQRNPVHRLAARTTRYLFQEALIRVMATGRSTPPLRAPKGVPAGRYYDVHALNYYTRSTVRRLGDGTALGVDVNDLGWEIYPRGLVELAAWVHQRYPAPIWITENGTCDADDRFRSRYVYEHLAQIAASSLPIERYYYWCLTDNWEWAEGEGARFGLVHLDFDSQQRTVKDSGRFYSDIIANRGVTEASYLRHVAGRQYTNNRGAP